jgi:hypothetical protein
LQGARIVFRQGKRSLTIDKRHQIGITELEIEAVGTDFSRRTSWWTREDPEGPECENQRKTNTCLTCMQMQQMTENVSKSNNSG